MVELRWLIAKVSQGSSMGVEDYSIERVLQYRYQTVNPLASFLPGEWSEWQTVPVVPEAEQ